MLCLGLPECQPIENQKGDEKVTRRVTPLTQVRMLRSRARFYGREAKGNAIKKAMALSDLARAKEIAAKNKLLDQLVKIKADWSKIYWK